MVAELTICLTATNPIKAVSMSHLLGNKSGSIAMHKSNQIVVHVRVRHVSAQRVSDTSQSTFRCINTRQMTCQSMVQNTDFKPATAKEFMSNEALCQYICLPI